MSAQVIPARFALRRRTAAAWASLNEVLKKGEPGVEIDTGFGKTGDGVAAWNDLAYVMSGRMILDGLEDGKCLAWEVATQSWVVANRGVAYVPGAGIEIDVSDPQEPIISSTLGSIALAGREVVYADLPTSGLSSGNAYYVEADDLIYIWNGSAWPAQGAGVSLHPQTDPYGYATTCLIQPKVNGMLDRALPARWNLLGDASMSAATGIDFGTAGFLYRSVSALTGPADFTVEGYWTPSSLSGTRELFAWSDGTQTGTANLYSLFLEIVSTGKLRVSLRTTSNVTNADFTTSGVVMAANTERHVAVTMRGTTLTVWVNGAPVGSATVVGARTGQQSNLRIGQLAASDARQFVGKMKAFRVTSGVARYTATFSPPPLPWPGPT